ncbi:MAG: TonB family protein [Phaeodactylibacter sp.]|nr:TonB family protein [Phaeodactylibacter sp.]MCB9275041.1 TonB family protein [Lewinellaceae bacterium]
MITYILGVTLCWAAFYVLYACLLSRSTFFKINRAYLLGALLLSLVLPLVKWPAPASGSSAEMAVITLQPITVGIQAVEVVVTATASDPGLSLWDVLLALYWLGVAFSALRFGYGLSKLWRLYRQSERQKAKGYTLALTETWHTPFSFFRVLFWSRQMPYPPEDEEKIIRHEQAHMHQWHSLDVLLVELLSILFWPSPMVFLYSRSLRVVHEYLADHAVLRHYSRKKQYGHLLLRQAQAGPQIALANYFLNSQLKKRIVMMTKTKSKRQVLTRYLLVLPLLFGLVLAFAQQPEKGKEAKTYGEIFKVVEEMPRFPGCEGNEGSASDKMNCANMKLMEYIGASLKYPEDARKANIEGMAVVRFIINTEGELGNIEIVRSLSPSIDAEVIRVVEQMNEKGLRWRPGYQRGKAVDVELNLPVKFSLGDGEKRADAEIPATGQDEVFKVVEEMPLFPGCEDVADAAARKKCADMKMLEFIFSQLKYPQDARDAGIEGTVVASFVVNKEGRLEDIKAVRSVSPSIDAEVLRVIGLMNDMEQGWVPGKQRGKVVKVQFNLPVQFKLDDKDKKPAANTLELKQLSVSPNPAAGTLNLRFEAEALPTTIRIMDGSGREVLYENLEGFDGRYDKAFDLSRQPRGAYVLLISQGNKAYTEKVILK